MVSLLRGSPGCRSTDTCLALAKARFWRALLMVGGEVTQTWSEVRKRGRSAEAESQPDTPQAGAPQPVGRMLSEY
jgi:hypothetical protein